MCSKCVLTDEIKEITFDKEGVCNFCRTWERLEQERLKEKQNLPKILEKLKKGFIIGLSGGMDSSYLLHLLAKAGLKPKMAFSFIGKYDNPLARENVEKLVEALEIPFERIIIDGDKYDELQRAYLIAGVPNIEVPTDHILMALTYQIADDYGVKYVVGGGNHANEGIMPEEWSYPARDLVNMKDIYKSITGKKLKGLPMCGVAKWNYYKWIKGIEIINLLDYYEYKQVEAGDILYNNYGWQSYPNKHEENYYTQWFQNCYLPVKFGIDKRRAHYSSLINSGQITKEEALNKLNETLQFKLIYKPEEFMVIRKRSHSDFKQDKWFNIISKIIRYAKQ